jgi:hypothetical protein
MHVGCDKLPGLHVAIQEKLGERGELGRMEIAQGYLSVLREATRKNADPTNV